MFSSNSRRIMFSCVPLLALLGCKGQDIPDPGNSKARYALTPFQSCEELESHLADLAVESLVTSKYSWGWSWGEEVFFLDSNDSAKGDDDDDSAPQDTTTGTPDDYTTTNIQELGVDEPDIVKTDGEWIYAVQNGMLYIIHAWPAKDAELVATLDLDGRPDSLFLHEDRLVAFANNGGGGGSMVVSVDSDDVDVDVEDREEEIDTDDWGDDDDDDDDWASEDDDDIIDTGEKYWGDDDDDDDDSPNADDWYGTQILVIDIADRTDPQMVRNLSSQGSIVSGRMIESNVYLVQN
ncbi:MAG: hypothetical protein HN348_24270, partial [Proteobacteria bacterium]|nr:hypothetical protein [Pseudomonadota bacterium]